MSWMELTGSIIHLGNYKGLPEKDDNYLNNRMGQSNELFANLLETEDKCQISLLTPLRKGKLL